METTNKDVTLKSYFTESATKVKGITFKYVTNLSNGEEKTTYHVFPMDIADSNQDTIFKSWKEIHKLFWLTKSLERGLKVYNCAIACKLKTATPKTITIVGSNFEKEINVVTSAWRNIGLIPSKKDYDRINECTAKQLKHLLHNAAVASFNVLGFRVAFEKESEK